MEHCALGHTHGRCLSSHLFVTCITQSAATLDNTGVMGRVKTPGFTPLWLAWHTHFSTESWVQPGSGLWKFGMTIIPANLTRASFYAAPRPRRCWTLKWERPVAAAPSAPRSCKKLPSPGTSTSRSTRFASLKSSLTKLGYSFYAAGLAGLRRSCTHRNQLRFCEQVPCPVK
jgi:hypothetical protein